LQKLGLKRGDVQFVEAGTTLQRMEALARGDIAATPLNEPVNIMAEQRGLPKLVDLAENTPWILNGIVVDRRYLAAHHGTMLEFLRAYTEAIQFALSNPARTEAILTARFGTLEPRVAAATFADFQRRVPRDAAPSLAAAENMLRTLPQLGTRVASRRVADYVDTAPIDALRREGFFGRLAEKYPPKRP
jgi:ABC-type nitrate/sulfonate/bicarbonate transport system substrate-binding protein